MRQFECRMAILDETCTHDGTTIEVRVLMDVLKWPTCIYVPRHLTRTLSTTRCVNQRLFAPSR